MAKNLLLYPEMFQDGAGNSPPAIWDGEKYAVVYNYDNNWAAVNLTTSQVQAGDTLEFRSFSPAEGAAPRVYVYLNDEAIHVHYAHMDGSDGADRLGGEVERITLPEGGTLRLELSMEAGYDRELEIYPYGEREVEEPEPEPEPEAIDTYSLKGFLSFGPLVDNTYRKVAALGELSVHSQTFSRDRESYSTGTGGSLEASITATVFSSQAVDIGKVAVPAEYGELIADMGAWMYTTAADGIFTADPDVFRQQFLAEFGHQIYQLSVGPMIQQGTLYLPESVTFYLRPNDLVVGEIPDYLERSRIRLWLSDAAFSAQYDEYSYEFIAPIDHLDDFFKPRVQIEELVRQRTQQQLFERVQALADGDPYTILTSENFSYRDPTDPDYRLPTNWTFLIYGAAGMNIDAIKERLIDWILEHSEHPREEWAEIFPDIFTSTEFIIAPMWSNYAIPNRSLEMGVYSPTVPVQQALTIARRLSIGTNYHGAHVDRVAAVVGTTYKSISMVAVGGPDNRDGVNRFQDQWQDYIAVSTQSIDFDRMSPETQGWIELLYRMLAVAEEMTEFSDIPLGMSRLKRTNADGDSVIYLVASYRNVQYLVVSKLSMSRYFPPVSMEPLTVTSNGVDDVTAMPNGSTGEAYVSQFVAKGGSAPYTYSLVGEVSSNVSWQSIDSVTGEYQAQFEDEGQVYVTVRVRDSADQTVEREFSLWVGAAE